MIARGCAGHWHAERDCGAPGVDTARSSRASARPTKEVGRVSASTGYSSSRYAAGTAFSSTCKDGFPMTCLVSWLGDIVKRSPETSNDCTQTFPLWLQSYPSAGELVTRTWNRVCSRPSNEAGFPQRVTDRGGLP